MALAAGKPSWSQVLVQPPGICSVPSGNRSYGHQPNPWLLLDHGPRHGPRQPPRPGWHHCPSSSTGLPDQRGFDRGTPFRHKHGRRLHPSPQVSMWPFVVPWAMNINPETGSSRTTDPWSYVTAWAWMSPLLVVTLKVLSTLILEKLFLHWLGTQQASKIDWVLSLRYLPASDSIALRL